MISLALAVLATACQTTPAPSPGHQLIVTGVGRFAVFADLETVQRSGDQIRMRALQVVEPGFEVDGKAYWGGWSWWAFDCKARTADRLDFASVLEGGLEGPPTPDTDPPYDAAPGGDAAELLAVACSDRPAGGERLSTVAEAVRLGQALLLQ